MDRPYDSIPRQGEHLGSDLDEEPTTNVRGQQPAKPRSDDSTARGIIQCSYNEAEGHYRIRRWQDESQVSPSEGYEEIRRIRGDQSPEQIYQALPVEPRFIVLENVETGKVYFDRERKLTGDWTGDGDFDQVTVFETEDAATRYAEARQGKS